MNEHVYMHGVGYLPSGFYVPEDQRQILEKIFNSGALLSMRLQGRKSNEGFSGLDYISLCDLEKKHLKNTGRRNYNTYYNYVINSLSLAFDKDKLEVIEPFIVNNCSLDAYGYAKMKYLGESPYERYSDMPDEVQVKDSVSLDNMRAITFPTKTFIQCNFFKNKKRKLELLKEEINKINELIDKYGYDVKVYDIETLNEMNEENIERLVLKR